MEEATASQGKARPIDPLINEMRERAKNSCALTLSTLGIPLMTGLDGGVDPELATAQALLLQPYELALPVVTGVKAEVIPVNQERERVLSHPQAFVDATVGLLQSFYEKEIRDGNHPTPLEPAAPITVESALAVGCLIANPSKLPEKSQIAANLIINDNPAAGVVLKGLQALQRTPLIAPTK